MNAKGITRGIIGGLAGGALFGAMMGAMGMLPMIGKMVGHPSAAAGFLVHMMLSAVIGAAYGLTFGRMADGVRGGSVLGLVYGAGWWVLGPLTLMPLMMGMGLHWSVGAAVHMFPSLMGHMMFGLVLGWIHARLGARPLVAAASPLAGEVQPG